MARLMVISSQLYLDEETVKQKMKRPERWIHLTPPFLHEGKLKAVLIDGHHSLEASKRLGIMPKLDFVIDDDCIESIDLLFSDEIDWFLEWNKHECDYRTIYNLEGDYEPVN